MFETQRGEGAIPDYRDEEQYLNFVEKDQKSKADEEESDDDQNEQFEDEEEEEENVATNVNLNQSPSVSANIDNASILLSQPNQPNRHGSNSAIVVNPVALNHVPEAE